MEAENMKGGRKRKDEGALFIYEAKERKGNMEKISRKE